MCIDSRFGSWNSRQKPAREQGRFQDNETKRQCDGGILTSLRLFVSLSLRRTVASAPLLTRRLLPLYYK